MFDPKKATDMAIYLLKKAGGQEYHIKIIKLMYLAERESYQRYHEPMCHDKLFSLGNGPILSQTLDMMNGYKEYSKYVDIFAEKINTVVNNHLSLREIEVEDYGHLSKADKKILDDVWEKFGDIPRFELCEWTHMHCDEWQNPEGSMLPIRTEELLQALGIRNKEEINSILSRIEEADAAAKVFNA